MKIKSLHIDELVQKLRVFGDVVLLESQKVDHPASKVSYLAAIPDQIIFGLESNNYIKRGSSINQKKGNPWLAIKDFQLAKSDWMFGYIGYDLKNFSENLESKNPKLNSLPDYYFMVPKLLIEIDVKGNTKFLKGDLSQFDPGLDTNVNSEIPELLNEQSISKELYGINVEKSQDLIHEGDIYEVNYSYSKSFDFKGSGWNLYQKMRSAGPVPFGAYLQINDIEVSCASPERFLRREKNSVFSQPIKGTISNSDKTELVDLKSEKNLAENLMIVDLVRNDLNRIAIPGSVKVKDLFEVQSFETVHQLVSTVECEVEDKTNSVDIIEACFPMGSMTGAPKISAMQAIEDLEDYKRGIYSGAIGYIKPDGDFDFNVVIRTAIIEGQKLTYPVGGAITSDSIPEDEWQETLVKTEALKKALK